MAADTFTSFLGTFQSQLGNVMPGYLVDAADGSLMWAGPFPAAQVTGSDDGLTVVQVGEIVEWGVGDATFLAAADPAWWEQD